MSTTTPDAHTAPATSDDRLQASSPNHWRARIDECKTHRNQLVRDWATNIDFRRGKAFEEESDLDRVNVNYDWPNTKRKAASLFSQVPTVNLTPKRKDLATAIPVFGRVLNAQLTAAGMGTAVNEVMVDVINAAGFGAVAVGYERRTETVQVPAIDVSTLAPEVAAQMQATNAIPMRDATRTTSERYTTERFSPSDLLWPLSFTGSDFNKSPWIGRSGVKSWAEAKPEFKLSDADRDKVCSGGKAPTDTLHPNEIERVAAETGMVEYDEIFYWRHVYHTDEKYFDAIQRVVFVTGKQEPVIDEPWQGQRFDAMTGLYVGSCKFPIQVLTLDYLSDEPIPPSNTAISRPQILELIRSRSQMILQRDRSQPIRWFDVNRVDPDTQALLMKGTYQGMIPLNGSGNQSIGEVARANYPAEDMAFDRVIKDDLQTMWALGDNQLGNFASGERSASEANIVQANAQSLVGQERARVAAFICNIAEVFAGLLSLYGDRVFSQLPQEEQQRMAKWDRAHFSTQAAYAIRPDATVLLDSRQRRKELMDVLNMVGKSGFVAPQSIIVEILELSGIDPADVMTQPTGPKPEPLSISIRSAEDLRDPMMLALLLRTGQAPTPQELDAAFKLQQTVQQGLIPTMTVTPATQGTGQNPNPDWNMMDRIDKRTSAA